MTYARAKVWLDGTLVAAGEARASVLSHAMQRGSLVFDVGALRPGSRGPVLFRPREHIARFMRSAALVGLQVPWSEDTLLRATHEAARSSGTTSGLVRWSAYIPSPEVDVVPRGDAPTSVAIAVIAPDGTHGAPPVAKAVARVMVPSDVRKAGPEVFPPEAKAAASYLGPMLAKRRALAAGFDEVVLLDGEGHVAEAPTANVFVVRGGTLATPPLGRVLPGITRASVIAIAEAEGIPVREELFGLAGMESADEAFLVATSLPVQAVASVNGKVLPGGAPGPVTARIKEVFVRCERGDDPRFAQWTEYV